MSLDKEELRYNCLQLALGKMGKDARLTQSNSLRVLEFAKDFYEFVLNTEETEDNKEKWDQAIDQHNKKMDKIIV